METTERQEKLSKAKRLFNQAYRYYVPTGVGEQTLDLLADPTNFITMLSAANGIGKTALDVNLMANLCWPGDNEWFDYPLFIDWPYPKRIRIISDPATITSTLIPEMKNWFPKGRYKCDKKGKHYEYEWQTDTGWLIEVMSYDQDPKEFESATLGLAILDEPPPESIYKATIARMRTGGKVFVTQTPLSGSTYLYDQIITNKDNEAGKRAYIQADVESACVQHGVRGFLEHEHIENMVSQYSEDEKQARIHGKFQHLTGMIFKRWDRGVHVIRPFRITPQEYVVFHALDPHPRNNDAGLWVAVDKDGTKFVINELWLKCQDGTEELAERIRKINESYRVDRKLIDPSAGIIDQHTGKSLKMRLSVYGLSYIDASKDRVFADRRIGDALNYQMVAGNMLRTPELYIFDTCQRTIYEMEHYRWDEWRGKTADNKNQREKPVDKDDHMVENLGRILVQEPTWTPYRIERFEGNTGVGEIAEQSIGDPYA